VAAAVRGARRRRFAPVGVIDPMPGPLDAMPADDGGAMLWRDITGPPPETRPDPSSR